ncbi:MAG: phage tail protein [Gammaproteobacteria bacterium]
MPLASLAQSPPPVGFRFSVFFFMGGAIPNPLDLHFSKVSGLGSRINTQALNEGGQNLYTHHLPTQVQYDNLVLERGMVMPSMLSAEFNVTMSLFEFNPSNVLVTLLDENGLPISGWLFTAAYPVKWTISDLAADQNTVVIETMELAYQRMQAIRL